MIDLNGYHSSPFPDPVLPATHFRCTGPCARLLSGDEFKWNYGKRMSECKKCHQERFFRNALSKWDRVKRSELKSTVGRLANRIEVPHISQLAEGMVKEFGGLEPMCHLWHDTILEARQKGHLKLALDSFVAIKNLIQASTQHRSSAPDVAHLDPEELRIQAVDLLMNLMANNPDDMSELRESVMQLFEPQEDMLDGKLLEHRGD